MSRARAVADWLPEARWFAGKAAGPVRIDILDRATIPGTSLDLAIVEARAGEATERYVLVLGPGGDAAATPEAAGWLVETCLSGGRLAGEQGEFVGHPTGPGGGAAAVGDVAIATLGGDASNTSLAVSDGSGRRAVKILRRVREGIQPEVEVGEFLARVGWPGTPRLLGWLDYRPAGGPAVALATVHEFIAGAASLWDRLVADCRSGGLAGPRASAILGLVAEIGRTTATMHEALASRPDIPAFAAEPPPAGWAEAEAAGMVEHARGVFDLARARLDSLPPALVPRVQAVLERRPAIEAGLLGLARAGAAADLVRVHGDFHLGQVLVREAPPGVLVIDFEGEPGRSLEARRRKTSVFKDVAGMCRSFDYLLRHVARSGGPPYARADRIRLEACFIEAYRGVAAGHAWWPDAPAADRQLAAYTLDKAVYELAYELANRPDWVEVPLAALLE